MRPPLLLLAVSSAVLLSGCDVGQTAGSGRYHGVVEIQEVHVGSKVGGRVAETPVAEGTVLKAGDVLVRFEVPELEAARAEGEVRLKIAEADLARARNGARPEEIAAARAAVESARSRAAMMRAGARPEEIAAARADLDAAAAELKVAEEDLVRNERLLAERVSTRAELDAARAARDRAKGRHAAERARVDLLLAGNRKEDVDGAEAEVRRREAEEALLLAGTRAEEVAAAAARVEGARAALRTVDVDLAEAVVRAPEPAVLEVLSVRKGDVVAPGAPVARLHRTGDLWVKVFVPETEIGKVRLGQAAEATVDSFPGRTFTGTVSWIAVQAEFTPRNVQSADERRHQVFAVKVVVADPEGVFKSGMAAEVALGAR